MKEKEVWRDLVNGLKFLVYNKYEDLEKDLQDEYGEIGTYVMNFLFGLLAYLKQHKEVAERLFEEIEKLKNE